MKEKFCQSCCMPMGDTEELYGMDINGAKTEEYCKYCYVNGKFTFKGTMEEMIEMCAPHMVNANTGMTQDKAKNMMLELFPQLKRWKSS